MKIFKKNTKKVQVINVQKSRDKKVRNFYKSRKKSAKNLERTKSTKMLQQK